MSPLLWFIASLIVRAWCWVIRPHEFTCPRSTYVNGVRPDGSSECVSAEDPRPDDTKGACHHGHLELPAYPIAVRCSRGEIAVVVDARTVACARRRM